MASQTHHMGAGSGKSQAADGKNSMSIIDIRSVLVATVHTATKFDLVDVVDDWFSCDTDLQKVGEQEKACEICSRTLTLFETDATYKGICGSLEAEPLGSRLPFSIHPYIRWVPSLGILALYPPPCYSPYHALSP